MARIPTPRSFNQILGAMLDTFLSHTGLSRIRPGSPFLSFMMASAQSDLRSSKDTFDLLNSTSLDRATGQALDRIGQDEDTPRFGEFSSSGLITVTDSRYTKISTKIFQGHAAPIVGSATIYVADASSFTATGQIYIGRGTANFEGPLAYTAVTNFGTYWTLTLTGSTLKYHNLGEAVVMAQGGNRTIPANSVVQTPQAALSSAVQFATSFVSVIPDGEIQITVV